MEWQSLYPSSSLSPYHPHQPCFSNSKYQDQFGWACIHKWIKMSKVFRIKGKPKLEPRSTRQPREPICSQIRQPIQTQLKGWQQDRLQNLPRSQMLLLPKLGMRVPDCHPTEREKEEWSNVVGYNTSHLNLFYCSSKKKKQKTQEVEDGIGNLSLFLKYMH